MGFGKEFRNCLNHSSAGSQNLTATEGKGNPYEAYASVLMMTKDIPAIRQLLFQILCKDTTTERHFKAALQTLRAPDTQTNRRTEPPTIATRDAWADDIERWSSDAEEG